MTPIQRAGVLLLVTVAAVRPAIGQQSYDRSIPAGGPFSRTAVLGAPFSADAVTSIQMPPSDGPAHVETLTAHYYRNSQGQIRAELDTSWGPYVVLEIPDPEASGSYRMYRLDPSTHTYRVGAGYSYAARIFNGEGRIARPVGSSCFQLAPPVIADASDEERLRAVNAQLSSELGIVIASHRSDGIGIIDYQVTRIRRDEPPASLFDLAGYSFVTGSVDDPLVGWAPWNVPPRCGPPRH